MCGIIAIKRFDGGLARRPLDKRYRKQKERGQQGFGYVSLDKGTIKDFKKAEREEDIMREVDGSWCDEIIFHHRNPTSTPNFWECAHPIFVGHKSLEFDYFVVHNGVIRDTEKMREAHEKLGFKYTTEVKQMWKTRSEALRITDTKWNDSESFAIELARDLDGDKLGLSDITGSVAFVALQVRKNTSQAVGLYWGRNFGSPLYYERTNEMMVVTSVGKGQEVEAQELFHFDYGTRQVKHQRYVCGYSYIGGSSRTYVDPHEDEEWDRDTRSWVKKPVIGFSTNEPLPIIGAEDESALDNLLDLEDQLKMSERTLEKGLSTPEMEIFLKENIYKLRESIAKIRHDFNTKLIEAPDNLPIIK